MSWYTAGRLITTNDEERLKEIARLRERYSDALRNFARFRAEYPYTLARAKAILERRADKETKKKTRKRITPILVEPDTSVNETSFSDGMTAFKNASERIKLGINKTKT